ncbi:MAG: hypothetical protein GX236_00145 [Clostridiaceae bacterium]|nr:hypothetical protein [Clostridiaceae bacterium]
MQGLPKRTSEAKTDWQQATAEGSSLYPRCEEIAAVNWFRAINMYI